MCNSYKGKKRKRLVFILFTSPACRAFSTLNSVVSFLVPFMPRKPWDVILIHGIYCLFSGGDNVFTKTVQNICFSFAETDGGKNASSG